MRKIFLVFTAILFSFQISKSQSEDLIGICNLAADAVDKGQYALADSLYSLCVDRSANSDIYYNRSQVRRLLLDTCGFCKDLEIASDIFGDKEAESQYINFCLNYIDTTFYSMDLLRISKNANYRFYQVLRRPVCDTLTYINFHDIKGKKRVTPVNFKNLSSVLNETYYSDIIGQAYLQDTIKRYYYIRDLSIDKTFEKSSSRIQDFSRLLNKKYKHLKVKRNNFVHVHLKLYINKEGKIMNAKILDSEINNINLAAKDLKSEISSFFQNNLVLDPIIFQNQTVFYETNYVFDF